MNKKIIGITLAATVVGTFLTGCSSDADTVAANLSQEAEAFNVQRRITAINAFDSSVVLQVEGRCSLETADSSLADAIEITCKIGPDEYLKDFYYPGDNGMLSVEQTTLLNVDEYHYEWIIKPETLLPHVEIRTGANDTGDGNNDPTVTVPTPSATP